MALFPTAASNFPGGFNNVTIRGIPITQAQPGQVYWVSNSTTGLLVGQVGGSDGNNGSFNAPFATLQKAIDSCVAGRGDIVFVKPNHAETITSATTLLLNKAGVAIIGLGNGTARPTLTFTTANTATIPVSADNMSLINFLFVGNFLSIASVLTVGAAAYFTLQDCEAKDTSAVLGFLSFVTTTVSVNADSLWLIRNKFFTQATTNTAAAFVVLGTMRGLRIEGCSVTNTVDRANVSVFLSHAALVMTDALIQDNYLYCVNSTNTSVGMFISTSATTGTGLVVNNVIRGLDVAAALIITAAAVQYGMFNNLYIGDGTMNSGFLLPAIGSDS